jgi:hypothetical protein
MSERDVDVLGGVAREQSVCGGFQPWVSKNARNLVTVSNVVVVHDIIHVLEAEPVVGREEVQGAEGRRTANDGFVTAKLLHSYDVIRSEVETWSLVVQTCNDGLGVYSFVFLRELAR